MKEFNFYLVDKKGNRYNKTFKAYNLEAAYRNAKSFAKSKNLIILNL